MRLLRDPWLWLGAALVVTALAAGLWLGEGRRAHDAPGGLDVEAGCNARAAPCHARGDDLDLRFGVDRDASPLAPFGVQLRVDGPDGGHVEAVAVRFAMEEMDMGPNRYRLTRSGSGVWRGEATLPVCRTGSRRWLAHVHLDLSGDVTRRATFPLELAPREAGS